MPQRNFHFTKTATTLGSKKINRKMGSSSWKEYPARDIPNRMFQAAATNQTATKATVASVMDHELAFATSLATPRQTAQSTKPPTMMIMVLMVRK
jgi:hypothetical protein